jgi:ubiquinone/menaquinone biosynthesis C-methylase UbiE
MDITHELVHDELDLLAAMVPLDGQRIIELGCGAAQLARALLKRNPGSRVTALEVDERQHAKNLANPLERLDFVVAGAQCVPAADASFDLALMLKSLHHVPLPLIATALAEAARVLRPGGHLYVSEPVYAGPSTSWCGCSTTRAACVPRRKQRWTTHCAARAGPRSTSVASTCRCASRTSRNSIND